jgi:hypothetical protein
VGEVEDIPLFFTLIPVLALLSNYDRENCLINVGTEGRLPAADATGSEDRMVSFGRWKLCLGSERPDLSHGFQPHDLSWHYRSLQRHMTDTLFPLALRRLLYQQGEHNTSLLTDHEVLGMVAHKLASRQMFIIDPDARMTLDELWKAVEATKVGKKFLQRLRLNRPTLQWGAPENNHKGQYTTDNKIILNKDLQKELTDCEWEQVIAMELGNASNGPQFQEIWDSAKTGKEYADRTLTLELETRNEVVKAYENGEFCMVGMKCKPIFPGGVLTLEGYLSNPKGKHDWKEYVKSWREK